MSPMQRRQASRTAVLYVQHARHLGGSCMSLRYLIDGLDRARFQPIVALIRPTGPVQRLYEETGCRVLDWSGLCTFEHTTGRYLSPLKPFDWVSGGRMLCSIPTTVSQTRRLVADVSPDIVHLNSAVLAPLAMALVGSGVPVVWHIREHPVRGLVGLRRAWLAHGMMKWPAETVFISASDRRAWVRDRRGIVVPNFVDLRRFSRGLRMEDARQRLGIPHEARVVLYLGGLSEIKGVFPLLKALRLARERCPDLVCLMPGSSYIPSGRLASRVARRILPVFGSGTIAQRFDRLVSSLRLEGSCIRLPYQTEVAPLIAASDVLVFPSIQPHFARPIIEASAMAKPSIGSDLDGVRELVDHERTGLLVPPGSVTALAGAILALLTDADRARRMGEAAYLRARDQYDARRQMQRIMSVYDGIINR